MLPDVPSQIPTAPLDTEVSNPCIKCRHVSPGVSGHDGEHLRCYHPNNRFGINLLTGKHIYVRTYAAEVRDSSELCGHSGKWFELSPYHSPEPLIRKKAPATKYAIGTNL